MRTQGSVLVPFESLRLSIPVATASSLRDDPEKCQSKILALDRTVRPVTQLSNLGFASPPGVLAGGRYPTLVWLGLDMWFQLWVFNQISFQISKSVSQSQRERERGRGFSLLPPFFLKGRPFRRYLLLPGASLSFVACQCPWFGETCRLTALVSRTDSSLEHAHLGMERAPWGDLPREVMRTQASKQARGSN